MIRFALRCSAGHEFEAWFRDGDGYEAQQQSGEISCPECADTKVEKALMAPNIGRSRDKVPALTPAQMRAALVELRRQVETHCDYVGEQFPEEARRIHYGEADPHPIYGEASAEEAKELSEEGIEVGRIPWITNPDA
ncbi:MAG: DUF1178 family protein [Alphaproteobacteria bacterium]|nr:DUF1178 family protein [Alphaproteobacteria bacterium]